MTISSFDPKALPDAQLLFLLGMFSEEEQKLIRDVRTAVRKRLPTANELLYDYFTFFVITYSSTEHPLEGIVTIAARPDGVRLYLMHGKNPLPDPKKLLQGTAKQTRYVPITTASDIRNPDIEALIAATIDCAKIPLPTAGKGRLIMRSISPKRRAAMKKAAPAKKAASAKSAAKKVAKKTSTRAAPAKGAAKTAAKKRAK